MADESAEVTLDDAKAEEPFSDTEVAGALSASDVSPAARPLTVERTLDMAIGAVVVAAEATSRTAQRWGEQARTLQSDAPEILSGFEEKGRPLREQLVELVRGGTDAEPREASAEIVADSPALTPTSPVSPTEGFTESLTSKVRSALFHRSDVPATSGTGSSGGVADLEIAALEQRVRELEREVAAPNSAAEAVSSASALSSSAPFPEWTPAEEATFVPDTAEDSFSLSDSPYAVSETETEVQQENALREENADKSAPEASTNPAEDSE